MRDISMYIQRWQNGEQRAAEAIYNTFLEPTFRLAYGLLGDVTDAEDATQDALTYALMHIDRYDSQRAQFSTWLHIITVSRCRNLRRRKRLLVLPLVKLLVTGQDVVDPAPSPERQVVLAQDCGEVWHAVQALSPLLREAVILRYWAGHTFREIAQIVGCPVSTAQSRVRLAYARLKKELAASLFADFHREQVP